MNVGRILLWVLLLMIAVPSVPCLAKAAPGLSALVDHPYAGTVRSRIVPPEGAGLRARSDHGSGSAQLETSGEGTARLILSGSIQEDADIGFVVDGSFGEGGWRSVGEDVTIEIAEDGRITGGGTVGGNGITFKGRIDERKLDLFSEITLRSPSTGGFPAGTRFQFRYELYHIQPRTEVAGESPGDDGCREVVYRLKLVPNLFGGSMGSVMVPECRR